jgi:predicted deacylase
MDGSFKRNADERNTLMQKNSYGHRPHAQSNRERCFTLDWPDNGAGVDGIFVREIAGGGDGPTLLMTAGEHGVELSGCAGIDSLCRRLADTAFRGTVLAIPCLMPGNIRHRAHTHGQVYGSQERRGEYDTYLAWPGRPDGSTGERLCHRVWTEVVSRADVVINFHAWQNSASCLFTDRSVPGAAALAGSFGNVFNILEDDLKGSLHSRVLQTGRPAALVETHGQCRIDPEAVIRVRQGLWNVMVTMGMVEGPLELPRPMFAAGAEHLIRAPKAGLFVPLKAIEQVTRAGELLGYMLDAETGERTDLVSPADGAIWLIARNGPKADVVLQGMHAYADPGDLVALIKEIIPLN